MGKTPSQHFNLPIIGTVTTQDLNCTMTAKGEESSYIMKGETFDVIAEGTMNDHPVYICNQWASEWEKEPLIIIHSIVAKVTLNSEKTKT